MQNNKPFSKMAAENSNKLELAKIKIVYQHYKEHLFFTVVALQSFSISAVNFSIFDLHFLSLYYT